MLSMSALGQKRTFAVRNGDVRFTPESGHGSGGNAVSIPDHHCPVTLAVMPHRARHGLASR